MHLDKRIFETREQNHPGSTEHVGRTAVRARQHHFAGGRCSSLDHRSRPGAPTQTTARDRYRGDHFGRSGVDRISILRRSSGKTHCGRPIDPLRDSAVTAWLSLCKQPLKPVGRRENLHARNMSMTPQQSPDAIVRPREEGSAA